MLFNFFLFTLLFFSLSNSVKADQRLEFWFYRTEVTDYDRALQAQLRYYNSFKIHNDWKGNVQLSFAAGNVEGPKFKYSPQSEWEPGNTRLTLTATTPTYENYYSSTFGLRVYSPLGNSDPAFNTGQWEIGPTIAFSYVNKDSFVSKISPLFRYMDGFDDKLKSLKPVRVLEFLPEITIKASNSINFLFWQHNGIVTNLRNGHYVIPFDAQLEYNINKEYGLRIGSTIPIYDQDKKQIWQLYSSLIYRF